MNQHVAVNDRFIRLPEVMQRFGLSRSTVLRMVADGRLPKPRKIGARAVAWLQSSIDVAFAQIAAS
jgi:prophage regulatory protein